MAEGLTGMLGGLLGGSGGNVAQSLLKLAQSQGGGLGELVSKFTGSGDAAVAGKAQSWVGTGANEPISGEQVEHTLGSDTVARSPRMRASHTRTPSPSWRSWCRASSTSSARTASCPTWAG